MSEAYRTLRTNLSFYSLESPLRSLVVTSPVMGEGKSSTVANLAVTMAQSGRKTALVDCDLRRPSLHTLLNLKPEPGFTDAILNNGEPVLQETAVPNLWLLAAGTKPPNPADILGTPQVDQLIARLLEKVDIILFDAPPVNAVTDAAVLGAKVDGVLLVLSAGKTRRDHAERAKEILEKAHVNIIGATLTNAPVDSSVEAYYG
ncbi:MAG: CpsD/CapB family tyrosine-protein kinase [Anaerolineales bacterium]|nr:CpsD/CapB family tyrosine-protein kinase [Anaerolineales bacterium]